MKKSGVKYSDKRFSREAGGGTAGKNVCKIGNENNFLLRHIFFRGGSMISNKIWDDHF